MRCQGYFLKIALGTRVNSATCQRHIMDKNSFDSKCEDEILLNLKIKFSNFLATLRLKS